MPVTTRSQALQAAASSGTASNGTPISNSEGVFSLRSLNEALPDHNSDIKIKPSSATKAPLSHPLPAANAADELSTDTSTTLSISNGSHTTVPQPIPPPHPTAAAQQSQTPPPPKKFIPPEEKLLKPLPDKPIECTKLPDGPEPIVIEIEYPSRDELQPFMNEDDASTSLHTALANLESTEWSDICIALLTLRRVARYNTSLLVPELPNSISSIVKSVRNLRSALSKTAIITARDFYLAAAPEMLPLTDIGGMQQPMSSLLAQLLLKAASNDKKFVIEEAQSTLIVLSDTLEPLSLLPLLVPYIDHKNPKVRGKCAIIVAASAEKLNIDDALCFGVEKLLNLSAKLISDNTPDARDAAKKILIVIKGVVEDGTAQEKLRLHLPDADSDAPGSIEEPEHHPMSVWGNFCQKTLGVSKAAAILRAVP